MSEMGWSPPTDDTIHVPLTDAMIRGAKWWYLSLVGGRAWRRHVNKRVGSMYTLDCIRYVLELASRAVLCPVKQQTSTHPHQGGSNLCTV